MIKHRLIILLSVLLLSNGFYSQTSNSNHPTISTVKVRYKSAPQAGTGISEIKSIPEATVTLKTSSGVSKVFFKIFDATTDALIYEVNYSIGSSVITNAAGKKLFENNSGIIFISNGQAINLKPYVYKVYTEDSSSNATSVFSVTQ